jgi:hypothetical protein
MSNQLIEAPYAALAVLLHSLSLSHSNGYRDVNWRLNKLPNGASLTWHGIALICCDLIWSVLRVACVVVGSLCFIQSMD